MDGCLLQSVLSGDPQRHSVVALWRAVLGVWRRSGSLEGGSGTGWLGWLWEGAGREPSRWQLCDGGGDDRRGGRCEGAGEGARPSWRGRPCLWVSAGTWASGVGCRLGDSLNCCLPKLGCLREGGQRGVRGNNQRDHDDKTNFKLLKSGNYQNCLTIWYILISVNYNGPSYRGSPFAVSLLYNARTRQSKCMFFCKLGRWPHGAILHFYTPCDESSRFTRWFFSKTLHQSVAAWAYFKVAWWQHLTNGDDTVMKSGDSWWPKGRGQLKSPTGQCVNDFRRRPSISRATSCQVAEGI